MRALLLVFLLGAPVFDTPEDATRRYLRVHEDSTFEGVISCVERQGKAICEAERYFYLCYESSSSCSRDRWSCISLPDSFPPHLGP